MLNIHPSPIARAFLLVIGLMSLILGIVGVFLPLLPTTPFLLLASYSFARSNDRFNNWLLTNRFFGVFLQDYIMRKTIKGKIKWVTLAILWSTIIISIMIIKTSIYLKLFLTIVAIGVTIHLITLNGRNR